MSGTSSREHATRQIGNTKTRSSHDHRELTTRELDDSQHANQTIRRCRVCNARISRYAPAGSKYCAAHEPAVITRLKAPLSRTEEGVCKRGHNLDHTGYTRNKGNGKQSRKCRACHNLRQAAYRQRKAAA